MYYRIKATTIRTGFESSTPWMNPESFSMSFEAAILKCDPGIITCIEETEFLVLNGISQGEEILNQYKPSTVF